MAFFADDSSLPHLRLEALAKSTHGEGSRGGKIIGHTRSGKPIYAVSHEGYRRLEEGLGDHQAKTNQAVVRQLHPDFSLADHHDASRAHGRLEAVYRSYSSKYRNRGDAHHTDLFHQRANEHQKVKLAHGDAQHYMKREGHVAEYDRHPGSEFDYKDISEPDASSAEAQEARQHNLDHVLAQYPMSSSSDHLQMGNAHASAALELGEKLRGMDGFERLKNRAAINEQGYHLALAAAHHDALQQKPPSRNQEPLTPRGRFGSN